MHPTDTEPRQGADPADRPAGQPTRRIDGKPETQADRLFFDHHRVDDALWDALGDVFTEEERLELTWVLSEFIGLGKVMYVLGVQYGGHAHV